MQHLLIPACSHRNENPFKAQALAFDVVLRVTVIGLEPVIGVNHIGVDTRAAADDLLNEQKRTAFNQMVEDVLNDPSTEANALVTNGFGGADVITGDELDAKMKELLENATQLLAKANES